MSINVKNARADDLIRVLTRMTKQSITKIIIEALQEKLNKEQKLIGILKYGNSSLNKLKINPGDLVGYTPYGEYDFIIDGERLYCMKSNDIVIKYEYKGDEASYNPIWAQSSS